MDVIRATPRWPRTAVLGLGLAAGLVFALPVKTGSVACPAAHEGRAYCLLQHAWAPAAVKVVAAVLVSWLLADFLFHRLPAMRIRWRAGQRPGRHATDRGREAVLSDSVLAAASWGIVPEAGRQLRWRAVTPASNPAAAEALARLPEPASDDDMRIPAPGPPPADPAPVPVPFDSVRALTVAERVARARRAPGAQIVVIDPAEQRTRRRLRLAGDPALVVSCWSDASSARTLPDEADAPIRA